MSQIEPDYDLVSLQDYIDDGTDPSEQRPPVIKETWYSNNTACAFGPQFREIKSSLTDKWYMFTPIDLSRDGVQTFELIGSNKFVIGRVIVEVSGDEVRVGYKYFKGASGTTNTRTVEEFLTFFRDLDSVTSVDPEDMADNPFTFDTPFSISKDLDGDTNVLMYVRNVVTYRDYVDKTTKLRRFYANMPERKQLREQMLGMMDPYQ